MIKYWRFTSLLPITIITAIAILLRVFLIVRDSVPFAYDMGRDLLWAKDISFYHIPTLIGPAASIWGVYFGPFWYYFLSIPLFLTGGNPQSAVYASMVLIVAAGLLSYLLFKKVLNNTFALALSLMLLFNSTMINISTFAFHANMLPILTVLMIYFCYLAVVKNPLFLSLAFFCVSLMFHADPAPAVAFTPVPLIVFLAFKLYKSKKCAKIIFVSGLLYIAPFIPQILFEIRNNFVEFHSLLAYFAGKNPSLSGQLPLGLRIINRSQIYWDFFKNSFGTGNNLAAFLISILIIVGLYKFMTANHDKKLYALFKINLYTFVTAFLIFTFVITVEVKNWYLYPLIVLYGFLITFALIGISRIRYLLPVFLGFFLIINIYPFLSPQRTYQALMDPALLRNQLTAVDLIYTDAGREPFSAYVFTPSIYDHNYQYLFWWQGVRLKKGLPADFAYQPNVPDYVRNKHRYSGSSLSQSTPSATYLIIENAKENEFYTKQNWLANWQSEQEVWEKNINNAIIVRKITK